MCVCVYVCMCMCAFMCVCVCVCVYVCVCVSVLNDAGLVHMVCVLLVFFVSAYGLGLSVFVCVHMVCVSCNGSVDLGFSLNMFHARSKEEPESFCRNSLVSTCLHEVCWLRQHSENSNPKPACFSSKRLQRVAVPSPYRYSPRQIVKPLC